MNLKLKNPLLLFIILAFTVSLIYIILIMMSIGSNLISPSTALIKGLKASVVMAMSVWIYHKVDKELKW